MVEDANAPDDLLDRLDPVLQATADGIGGVANDSFALGNALRTLDTYYLAILVKDFVDVGVEHESAAVDCTDPTEALRNAS